MALSNVATPHDVLKAQALRFGFKYNIMLDQWVSDSGACIPASRLETDKMLDLMAQSAKLSQAQRDQLKNRTPPPFGHQSHVADAMAYSIAGLAGPMAVPGTPPKKRSSYEKLAVRLDIAAGETFPFEHTHIVETSEEVCLLIKHNDKVVLLRDDINLFPSDTLIASIRLLQ
jgi:hypothetical protein